MSQAEFVTWLRRIEAEYCEMPGLQLTQGQMMRLWSLDSRTCSDLVAVLVARGVLREVRRRGSEQADLRIARS